MLDHWQLLTSLGITAIAGVYVAWRLWRSVCGTDSLGCSSCTHCPAKSGGNPLRLLPIIELEIEDARW